MDARQLGGAINPFALTETLVGKRIDWNRIEDPLRLVQATLETPAERLFDGGKGSPIFFSPRADAPRTAGKASKASKITKAAKASKARKASKAAKAVVRQGFPAARDKLSATISPALAARLRDLLEPMVHPRFRTTEYSGASWKDPGDFFEEGSEFGDPVQGAVGDCWLIAALASVALTRPYAILQRNRTTGADDQAFVNAVDIGNTTNTTRRFEVTELLPVNDGSGQPRFARSAEAGEIWPGVYEKAFAKFRSGNLTDKPDILALTGGDCVDASARLVPGTTARYTNTDGTSADDLWQQLRDNCLATLVSSSLPAIWAVRSGRTINPMTAWTYAQASDAPDDIAYDATTGIVGWHCYSILGWMTRARLPIDIHGRIEVQRYIVLRNPWGTWEGRVDTLAGNWQSHEVSWTRTTPLNAGGVFAMTIESFKRHFAGLGVAR